MLFECWLFSIGFYINVILMALCIISLIPKSRDEKVQHLDYKIGQYSYPLYLIHWQVGAFLYWITDGFLKRNEPKWAYILSSRYNFIYSYIKFND